MARRLILALLALLAISIAAPAAATTCSVGGGASFVVPPDVAAQPGWTCNTVTPTYDTTNSVQNGWIDPAVTPNPQTGLTNIPAPSYGLGRITSMVVPERTGTGTGCTSFGLVLGAGGDTGCAEAKFRTGVDFSHYGPDDPIRNFGAPAASHLHCFFGNGSTNASSTYTSRFASGRSRQRRWARTSMALAIGIPASPSRTMTEPGTRHRQARYHCRLLPCDGSTSAAVANVKKTTLLVPGLRYVFGFNMDDGGKPSDPDGGIGAWLINGSTGVLDVANAANAAAGGSSTRYRAAQASTTQHFNLAYYVCNGATTDASADAGMGGGTSRWLADALWRRPIQRHLRKSATFSGSINGSNAPDCHVGGERRSSEHAGNRCYRWRLGDHYNYFAGYAAHWRRIPRRHWQIQSVMLGNICPAQTLTNAVATHQFWINISGPQCWDGKNLWSPGGYKHVVAAIFDTNITSTYLPE
jgi:hypothetical protein